MSQKVFNPTAKGFHKNLLSIETKTKEYGKIFSFIAGEFEKMAHIEINLLATPENMVTAILWEINNSKLAPELYIEGNCDGITATILINSPEGVMELMQKKIDNGDIVNLDELIFTILDMPIGKDGNKWHVKI